MIRTKWSALAGAALLGLFLVAVAVPTGNTALTAKLTASVQNQVCQGGNLVNVTLTATLSPPQNHVKYSWDFNNDGVFDTAPSTNPTVTHLYPDETNQTAVVKVTKGTRSATASVTFSTLNCP
jgi:uncharacterized protein (DUF58 family)